MAIKIVDNKKLEMTKDEAEMFHRICKSYDDVSFRGSDLFVDLFESDDNGIIVFLRPPNKRATTLEAYLFLVSLMVQQHLRIIHNDAADMANQIKIKMRELDDTISKIKQIKSD